MICPYRKSREERQCGNLTQTFEYYMACEENACPLYVNKDGMKDLFGFGEESCIRTMTEIARLNKALRIDGTESIKDAIKEWVE